MSSNPTSTNGATPVAPSGGRPTFARDAWIAYFSMEIGLDRRIPTYSGGLGMLAGDHLRAAADLGVPMVGVTLLYRNGYFRQSLDADGRQTEQPVSWDVDENVQALDVRTAVKIEGRDVVIRPYRYDVVGVRGHVVPVFLLDTDLDSNTEEDREITRSLYAGDTRHRLMQEIVLGIGGVRMLWALGLEKIHRYHMNEGHASLLVPELIRRRADREGLLPDDPAVRRWVGDQCVFTTHTPVDAGHDRFEPELVRQVVEPTIASICAAERYHDGGDVENKLNMTLLGVNDTRYINGVARRHAEVSRDMFPGHEIQSITNGVHAASWVSEPLAALFDKELPGWRGDNFAFREAQYLPLDALMEARNASRKLLIDHINKEADGRFDPEAFTIGFARRATAYKRADLLFSDVERLRKIARQVGPFQVVYAGKAHPADESGKTLIKNVVEAMNSLGADVRCVFLPNYGFDLCRLLVGGVDVWLNNPQPPLEASGTSGMKAALNGIPSLSTLDGWWLEGWIEGVTGWAIGEDDYKPGQKLDQLAHADPDIRAAHAESMYTKLESSILPLFHNDPRGFAQVSRNAIAINGSAFNTHRMVEQYLTRAYASNVRS